MKDWRIGFVAIASQLFAMQAARADVGFIMPTDLAYGYGNTTNESMQLQLKLAPQIEIEFAGNTTLVSSVRLRLDAADELEPGEAPLATYSPLSRPIAVGEAGVAELRDLYIERRFGDALWRIGKQQIVWGRLDGIKVLDVVNPQDYREFILDDFGESRIGLWSAYLDLDVGSWRGEVAIIPDGSGHVIPGSGAWFEPLAPRFRYGASTDEETLSVQTRSPANDIDATAVGLRASGSVGRVDLSLVAYSGNDPEPLGRILSSADGPVVERYYERRRVFGVSAETGLGNSVVRAEYALQPGRYFNTRGPTGLDRIRLDQQRLALGWDLALPASIFANLQVLLDNVSSAPESLVRPATDRISTLALRKSFRYDRLVAEARWYHSYTDSDDLVSFSLSYSTGGNTQVRLQADSFSGSADGLFGQFAERDRVVISVEHVF